jgi:hypothetical protein
MGTHTQYAKKKKKKKKTHLTAATFVSAAGLEKEARVPLHWQAAPRTITLHGSTYSIQKYNWHSFADFGFSMKDKRHLHPYYQHTIG